MRTFCSSVSTRPLNVFGKKRWFAVVQLSVSICTSSAKRCRDAARYEGAVSPSGSRLFRKRVAAIFKGFDLDDDGKITLDEIIAGSQKLHRAFSREANLSASMDQPGEHVHI